VNKALIAIAIFACGAIAAAQQAPRSLTRPSFAGEEALRQFLRDSDYMNLRRRVEADAKSLFALYQYGCLYGGVRLRWGFLDERLPAPWVHTDKPTLYHGGK
jgi:hypothetical protein